MPETTSDLILGNIPFRVLFSAISLSLYNYAPVTPEQVLEDLNKKGVRATPEEIGEILDTAYGLGGVLKSENNGEVSYYFMTLLDDQKKWVSPDGVLIYAESMVKVGNLHRELSAKTIL